MWPQVQAMTCVDGICPRVGIKTWTTEEKCRECGGELYPWDDVEIQDVPDGDEEPSGELREWMRERVYEQAGMTRQGALPLVERAVETFSCPADLTGCPVASKPVVEVPAEMFWRWIGLARQVSTEWIAYLLGREEKGQWMVEGMYFPRQRVSAAHCEAEEGEIREGTIGAVHSHVGMAASFSTEDALHSNHSVEIVVNRRAEWAANARSQLECGRWHRGAAQLRLVGEAGQGDLEELQRKMEPERGMVVGDQGSWKPLTK